MKVIPLYKPTGKTPLEMIDQVRVEYPKLSKERLAYAGRLDPMAEGLLLILVGEECKNRKEYERLEKEYEFEVLVGASTDTYDVMGMVKSIDYSTPPSFADFKKTLLTYKGKQHQLYPPFSSARVKGRPLFYWARENKLSEITIPSKEVEIYAMEVLSDTTITTQQLIKIVIDRVNSVNGEFRQQEIIKKWQKALADIPNHTFQVFKCRLRCSSGTYVRVIASDVGNKLQIPSLAFNIKRTKVGNYSV